MSLLWRDTGKTIRFFGIDGRSVVGIAAVLLHISWATLILAVALMVGFAVLERFDYSLPNALRKARLIVAGKKKRAVAHRSRVSYRSS